MLCARVAMVSPGRCQRAPESASRPPAMSFSSVVLPQPLRPTRHRRSRAAIASEAPSKSASAPKRSEISRKVRIGANAKALTVG